ncbi:hypothetical protein BJX66DRAFT_315862 [Aspergillus keveii]|uniref:Fungal N-terminal domain-containing protein n=1 Tax=Aspergillus keveii TaxID=714993 RepID=A0ABR4FNX2_9EURO
MSSITTLSDQTTASTLAKHTLTTLLALQDSLTACPPRIRDACEASALESACSRWLRLCIDIKAAESGCASKLRSGSHDARFEGLWGYIEDIHRYLLVCLEGMEGVVKGPDSKNNNSHHCTRSSSFCPFSTTLSSFSTPGVSAEDDVIRVLTKNRRRIAATITTLETIVKTIVKKYT